MKTLNNTQKEIIQTFIKSNEIYNPSDWNHIIKAIEKIFNLDIEQDETQNLIGDITHALIDTDKELANKSILKFIEAYSIELNEKFKNLLGKHFCIIDLTTETKSILDAQKIYSVDVIKNKINNVQLFLNEDLIELLEGGEVWIHKDEVSLKIIEDLI